MTREESPNRQPIAVVGVSALFPGSTDATGFWRDILAGTDLIRDVPASHWLVEDYYDPDPSAPDKTYARRGAFLDPVDFDALGWGVPPSTIPATDTSQLLALIVAQKVLEDAARERIGTLDRSRVSVILGVTSAQELLSTMIGRLQRPVWVKALREAGVPEDEVKGICDRIASHYVPWQEATFPGLLGNVVAGRIANRLDLGGTNCVTDAACASTFSALSMAVAELQLGHSDLVISGGVDTLNDIFMFMCFSKTPALSPSGDCRPFSDRADGTMLGEGLGMVALRRLADAERDGDRIYAVIRGVGTSSDGRSKSVYAPVSEGQAKALRRAYALGGYGPETVELVEAHGTGTKAGDVAEFEGLRSVFAESGTSERQWCALGSVKSQIGHTKAAAGAAGLFKAVMALHHRVLPPSIKIDAPNPKLNLEESPFYLSTEARPWIRGGDHPRRASVSAFGFGGSNFHVALEEYRGPAPRAERLQTLGRQLVVVCGADGADVARKARDLAAGARSGAPLDVLARTSLRAYDARAAARLALVATNGADLAAKLESAAMRIEEAPSRPFALPDGSAFGLGESAGKVAFLFPGQGSQYLGMGAELAMAFEAAREPWDRSADRTFEEGTPLHEVVFPRPGFGSEKGRHDAERLTRTSWAQPAIGCASLSQLSLLARLGISPDLAGGHSFGEVVALHAAGVLGADDVLAVARRRGELMAEAASIPGAMSALALPVEEVRELLARLAPRVVVANHNGPAQVVVSGPSDAVEELEAKLAAEGITARRLPVATAFHSGVVAASCEPFAQFLAGVAFEPPRIPVYSNSTAAPHAAVPDALRAALAAQIASTVRFVEMVEAMYEAGARTFVEVGPASVLTGLVGAILDGRPHAAVSLDRKGKGGVESLLVGLARLVAAGVPMEPARLFEEYRESAAAAGATAPKLAVAICGSNHGKVYPPPGGARDLPAPNPPRPAAAPVEEPVTTKAETVNSHPVPAPAPAASAAPAPAAGPSAWVLAFQESQRQTAEAHSVFQRAMAESHAAYLRVAEAGFAGLSAMGHALPAGAPQAQPTLAWPVAPRAVESPLQAVPAVTVPPAPVAAPPAPALAAQRFEPVAPPAAERPAAAVDLHALMLAVVAEKTGYPADMLNLGMDLEGDLGIDSIKRVEILSAVQEQAPGLPKVDMAHMAALRTLGAIVDYMRGLAGQAPGAPVEGALPARDAGDASPLAAAATAEKLREAAAAAPRPAPGRAPLGRYVLERIEAPAAGLAQPGLLGGGEVWITGGGALDEALAAELKRRGVGARATDAVPDGATAVVFLGGLCDVRGLDEAIAVNREAFRVARGLAPTLEGGRGLFVTAQDTGAAFGMGTMDGRRAWLSGLPALVKTASQEWPRASVKAIDLERGGRDAEEIARALAEELLHGGGEIEVALPAAGGRFTLRSVERDVEPGEPVIGPGDVVVVSGGARGVTSACLAEWARDSGARFVLLGRTALAEEPACCAGAADEPALKKALLAAARAAGESPAPAELGARVRDVLANREVRSTLAALEAAGSPARYEAVNVSDARELSLALARVREEWGPFAGVVHAAGVLADRKISGKTDEQFDRVFDTKVEGLRALLAATESDPLKLLCVFSSVSARCGNTGQADYAMANEVLAKVAWAEARRRPGLLVKSLGWGPWEAGMVTPQLKERFASLGVPMIPLATGARMFADEVRGSSRPEVELVLGGEPRAEALLVAGADARVDELELKVARRSHGYLAGHAINGTPVVPVVLAAEWFARAARGFRPGYSLAALHDLKVLKGIRLGGFDNGGDRFVIEARPLPGKDGRELQLDVRGAGGTHHYSARAELSAEPATPGEGSPHLPLEAWEGEAIYDDLLFHREAFELIEEMDGISDHGAGGRVRGVSRAGWENGPWQLDAAALDGGLQVAVLYGHRMLGGASLPTTIGRLRAFRAPGEGLLTATAHRRKVGSLSVTTDVLLSDDEGRPVAELTGVETHTYPRGNGKA